MSKPYGILLGIVGGVLIIKIVFDGFTTVNIIAAFAYIAYYVLYIVLVNDDKKNDQN